MGELYAFGLQHPKLQCDDTKRWYATRSHPHFFSIHILWLLQVRVFELIFIKAIIFQQRHFLAQTKDKEKLVLTKHDMTKCGCSVKSKSWNCDQVEVVLVN